MALKLKRSGKMSNIPRTDALITALYNDSCCAAAGMGPPEESPEEAYGLAIDLARDLERRLDAAREVITRYAKARTIGEALATWPNSQEQVVQWMKDNPEPK